MNARLALSLLLILAPVSQARAQGCAQCRDNMQAAPPSVQRAYRRAIELLALSGSAVFLGGVFLLRRSAR